MSSAGHCTAVMVRGLRIKSSAGVRTAKGPYRRAQNLECSQPKVRKPIQTDHTLDLLWA